MKLRILMLHSRYRIRGGEDISTRNEAQLLRDGGHDVDLVEYDNVEVEKIGNFRTALRTTWSQPAVRDMYKRLSDKSYDILHVQNYFPLISPAVLLVASRKSVATVQALRNYRLLCANAQLFREGRQCQKCVGRFAPWHGVRYGCYRNSLLGSAAITTMIATHKTIGTWRHHTDAFIAVSDFVRSMYVKGSFDERRIYVKPNAVARLLKPNVERRNQLAFVGRLSPEIGIPTLLSAWQIAKQPGKLIVAGEGPLEDELRARWAHDPTIEFLGSISPEAAITVMAQSKAIVIPSIWSEPFPRCGVEALSVGTPVIGAASGGITELLAGSRAGALFPPGDADALAALIRKLFSDRIYQAKLHWEAESVFNERYGPKTILARTEEIYRHALARRRGNQSGS